MNQDKFGCYRVGDLKFYSKMEAIEMHTRTGIHPHWDFNEAVFSCYDWTQEPTASLGELYRQRAQQIRDQYDYVILGYSGGADSENILHAFVDNDIKLDEVVSLINLKGTEDRDAILNEEIFKTAIPYAELLQDRQKFKHRVIDITDMQLEFWSDQTVQDTWIYEQNHCWSANVTIRRDWIMKVKEWRDMIEAGVKIGIVHGTDKPRLLYEDGRLCFRFIDIIDNVITVKAMRGEQPWGDELFYWSPDLPELMIKQAHIIRQYLAGDVTKLPWCSTKRSDIAYREHEGVKYWLTIEGLHYLIYPWYAPGKIVGTKPPKGVLLGRRDTWFYNLDNQNLAKSNWWNSLTRLWRLLPDYWKNDPNDMELGVKNCWSRSYFIEKD